MTTDLSSAQTGLLVIGSILWLGGMCVVFRLKSADPNPAATGNLLDSETV